MIFPLGGLILGAVFGAYRAKAKGGSHADMAQWGAVFALIFGIVGLFILIALLRQAV